MLPPDGSGWRERSRLPVHTQPNPATIQLGHGHRCSHYNARSCSLTSLFQNFFIMHTCMRVEAVMPYTLYHNIDLSVRRQGSATNFWHKCKASGASTATCMILVVIRSV